MDILLCYANFNTILKQSLLFFIFEFTTQLSLQRPVIMQPALFQLILFQFQIFSFNSACTAFTTIETAIFFIHIGSQHWVSAPKLIHG